MGVLDAAEDDVEEVLQGDDGSLSRRVGVARLAVIPRYSKIISP